MDIIEVEQGFLGLVGWFSKIPLRFDVGGSAGPFSLS